MFDLFIVKARMFSFVGGGLINRRLSIVGSVSLVRLRMEICNLNSRRIVFACQKLERKPSAVDE